MKRKMFSQVTSMPIEFELYELLGVAPDATDDEIKKAYRKKAKEHHPDKNINDPEAGQKFQEMAAAYEILNDPQTREIYDSHGMDGLSKNFGSHGVDPNDVFAQFFAGGPPMFAFDFGGPGPGRRRGKGEDSIIPCEVTLEDLYNGKSLKMNVEKEIVCVSCKGSGARGNAKPKPCSTCEGKGWTFINPGPRGVSRTQCRDCKGAGERLKEKERCKKCKGEKVVKEKARREIHIEKGMADRQRIVLAGAGDEEPGVPAGDVIFVLNARPHESFERSGNDLLANVKITVSEALLGFSRILIHHLDGRGVRVTSPPGKIIKPQDSIVLRGEGMPIYKRPDQKGDLYVILSIEMPDDSWLKTVDLRTLASVLPPKKEDIEPRPEIVDEADYEETDIVDFGEDDENEWEDDEDDDGAEPDCRNQ